MKGGFELIVIDTKSINKTCIIYHGDVEGTDFLYAVEGFFEDVGIEVDVEEVERISDELYKKAFSNWESLHFEAIPN